MGITSRAFQKLNDLGNPTVQKSEPLGRLPNRGYGGLIRTEKVQHLESGRVRRSSAGELGSVAKADVQLAKEKDAKGHGSNKRGFDGQKRWGNSAIEGVGVNSPAMMEARASFQRGAEKVAESWNNLDNDSRFAILSNLKMSASPDMVAADRANPDHHAKEFSELPKITQSEVESYMKSKNLVEKSVGKSLGVFSTMQALSKAGNSDGARKGWETRQRGGGGAESVAGGSHIVQDASVEPPIPTLNGETAKQDAWNKYAPIVKQSRDILTEHGFNVSYTPDDPLRSYLTVEGKGVKFGLGYDSKPEQVKSFLSRFDAWKKAVDGFENVPDPFYSDINRAIVGVYGDSQGKSLAYHAMTLALRNNGKNIHTD